MMKEGEREGGKEERKNEKRRGERERDYRITDFSFPQPEDNPHHFHSHFIGQN